jgi:hypothetical protein
VEQVFPGLTKVYADLLKEKVLTPGAVTLEKLHLSRGSKALGDAVKANKQLKFYFIVRRTMKTTAELAWFDSTTGPGAAFIHCLPPAVRTRLGPGKFLPAETTLYNGPFQLVYRGRLRLPIALRPETGTWRCRLCGGLLDEHGDHAYACPKARAYFGVGNHNATRDTIISACVTAGCSCCPEFHMDKHYPRKQVDATQQASANNLMAVGDDGLAGVPSSKQTQYRSDGGFNPQSDVKQDIGNTHQFDVSITHPTAPSNLPAVGPVVWSDDRTVVEPVSGGVLPGAAAEKREQEKIKHYTSKYFIHESKVHPFVIESGGRLGKHAIGLMRQIVLLQFEKKAMDYWYQRRDKDPKKQHLMQQQQRETMKRAQQGGYGLMFRRFLEKVSLQQQIYRASLLIAYQRDCVFKSPLASQLSTYYIRAKASSSGQQPG